MANRIVKVVVFIITIYAQHAVAYKEPTHELMAATAISRSLLGTDPQSLNAIGLWSLETQRFPSSIGSLGLVAELVSFGAKNEDKGSRSVKHFFDPTNDSGLRVLGTAFMASPDWALQDSDAPHNSSQEFAYREAKEYYRQALTTTDVEEYERRIGLTFQTIGQVIHHVQDMAQPEHVRNDPHLELPIPVTELTIPVDPSRYEHYTNEIRRSAAVSGLLSAPYPPVNFNRPRAFWKSTVDPAGAGRGMAEFTNRNFVSVDTNFRLRNGEPTTGAYDSPVPVNSELVPLDDLPVGRFNRIFCDTIKNDSFVSVPTDAACDMEFFHSQVTDLYTGETAINTRASSLSVLDQYLRIHNLMPVTLPVRAGFPETVIVDRLFTLNRFNFDAFHTFLLPRAVAYSTGLINHFFRGRLDIAAPAAGIYGVLDHSGEGPGQFETIRLKLRNSSSVPSPAGPETPELTGGTLRAVIRYITNPCYRDDLSGEINESQQFPSGACTLSTYWNGGVPGIAVSAPVSVAEVGDSFREFSFDFSASPIPVGVRDVILQVVYEGMIGDEEDGIAVGTRNISEPTYIAILNNTDFFGIDGVLYTPEEIRATPDLLARVDLDKDGEPDRNIDPEPISNVRYAINGTSITEAVTLEPLKYTRIAVLADAATDQDAVINLQTTAQVAGEGPRVFNGQIRAMRNQLDREPRLLSAMGDTRGIYTWHVVWFSKQVGPPFAPGDAVNSLPNLEEDPGPTPIGVSF